MSNLWSLGHSATAAVFGSVVSSCWAVTEKDGEGAEMPLDFRSQRGITYTVVIKEVMASGCCEETTRLNLKF